MTDVKMLPKDFLAGMKELLGKEYDQYIKSYEEEWKPGLRVNTLKLSPEEFLEFSPWKLSPVPWTKNGFYYDSQEPAIQTSCLFCRAVLPSGTQRHDAGGHASSGAGR